MKNLSKIIVLIALTLFTINCSKEDFSQEKIEAKTTNFSASTYTSEEIPEIISSFNKRIENKWNSISAKEEGPSFWVDEQSAIGVRDSIGNMTYSFRMYVQNSDDKSVYNLIVNKRVDGNDSPSFIMKYEFVDQDILSYSQMEEKKFNGKVDAFSLESFLHSINNVSKNAEPEPCYNDLAPNNVSINNNTNVTNSSQGTTSSGGFYTGTGSTSGYGTAGTSVAGSTSWASVGSTSLRSSNKRTGSVEVGNGCFCSELPDEMVQKGISSKSEDCPKGEMLIPINNYEPLGNPSCESFEFYQVGGTGVQVAGVDGIWDVVTKWDKCPGIGIAASYQTYYFHLPASWKSSYAAEKSADALAGAFFDLQKWFQKQPCSKIMTGVLAIKMDEFIKENFKEIGGQATRNAPLGWKGTSRAYKEDWTGTDRCN